MKTIILALPCAMWLVSCSWLPADGHARILRKDATPAPYEPTCVPQAQLTPPTTATGQAPGNYQAFISRSNYPRTFCIWIDRAKMQAEGPRHVEIDLARQRGIFVVNDEVVMDFPVCTGTKRKPTPTGRFRITQKNIDHISNIYDVPMPYFMRLTNHGIGMHVGDVFRAPASHGCIRLTREACIPLYLNAPSGTRVVIRSKGWTSEREPIPEAQTPQLANAAG